MSTDLLQALQIITKLGVDTVRENLRVLAIDDIALTIEEPSGDLVLGRVLDDGDIRSSSSDVSSPARLLRSTSAFLQTKLE